MKALALLLVAMFFLPVPISQGAWTYYEYYWQPIPGSNCEEYIRETWVCMNWNGEDLCGMTDSTAIEIRCPF